MAANDPLVQLHQSTALSSMPALSIPLVSREKFAELLGVTNATVYSMADRGYLPTIHLGGRRVFINLEALRLQCLAKAQEFA